MCDFIREILTVEWWWGLIFAIVGGFIGHWLGVIGERKKAEESKKEEIESLITSYRLYVSLTLRLASEILAVLKANGMPMKLFTAETGAYLQHNFQRLKVNEYAAKSNGMLRHITELNHDLSWYRSCSRSISQGNGAAAGAGLLSWQEEKRLLEDSLSKMKAFCESELNGIEPDDTDNPVNSPENPKNQPDD